MAEHPDNYDHPLPPPPGHLDHQPPTVPQHHQPYHQPQQQSQQSVFEQQQQNYQQQSQSSASLSRPSSQQQHQQPQPQQQHQALPVNKRPNTHQRSSTSGSGSKGRTFSLQSSKSHKSSGSRDHVHGLHETHEEKEARRLHSKADPSLAISEAEPSVVATMTQSSLAPLRSVQHKDAQGNPIADPDRSNPTRNRWERPLDTIRSFEAAIDGGYSRKSMHKEFNGPAPWQVRRSSYHPGPQAPEPRFQRDSYYGQRPVSHQFNSYGGYDGQPGPSRARNIYYDNHGQQGPYGGQQGYPRQRLSRMQTEPPQHPHARTQNIYPIPHNDRSYETVTSAAASGNSDQAGYQTDPTSSDSGSVERRSPAKLQPPNDYGIGFSQTQPQPSHNLGHGAPQQQDAPQPPLKHGSSLLRKQVPAPQVVAQPVAQPEKRKSWLSRRFSKNK